MRKKQLQHKITMITQSKQIYRKSSKFYSENVRYPEMVTFLFNAKREKVAKSSELYVFVICRYFACIVTGHHHYYCYDYNNISYNIISYYYYYY